MPTSPTDARTGLRRHSLFGGQVGEAPTKFPFDTVLSFGSVIGHWRRLASENPSTYGQPWAEIESRLTIAPELAEPIEDPGILNRHRELIDMLVRPLFPAAEWTNEARVLSAPFGGHVVRHTTRYEQLLADQTVGALEQINHHDIYFRTLYAYRAILAQCFDIRMRLDQPLIFVVPNVRAGVSRYFKFNADSRFVSIESRGELPVLETSDIDALLRGLDDLSLWMEMIPPRLFRFVGVTASNLTDVTDETATTAITHLVLSSDANVTEDNFDALESEVRILFGTGSLNMGLASLQADGALNVRSNRRIWNSLVIRDAVREGTLEWQSGLYGRALREGETVMLRDVAGSDVEEPLRTLLLDRGARSLFLQPLRYEDRIVGLLELSSPEPQSVDASTVLKMRRIAPIFSLAVFQNLEGFESRVESAIQRAYTAIHPSVQWRFREAAITMLERGKDAAEPASIMFEGLYPLYGSADIRGSTRQRTEASRSDVVRRLRQAQQALSEVRAAVPLIIIDEIGMQVAQRIERYEASWSAGDETDARQFLASEVEPLLAAVVDGRDALRPVLDRYREATNSAELSRAAAYESCRRQVNRLIAATLQREQAEAQELFAHYFEHAETDGVEHTIYIGRSITPDRPFDPAYVQNLRLRQLVIACEIGVGVQRLNESLPHPLAVAQLVVVQHAPVALRFRADEKRFDVDGPSGVRFEMLKKRLDKALVRGTGDRITQPGTVAVVYSTDAEAAEYRRYADYLVANGHIEPEPEVLDVEDLPGVSGLTALRLRVRIQETPRTLQ